jgi:hypothetical protein
MSLPVSVGKMYGFVTIAIGVGTSGGPLVAGVLFDVGGYWVAWSSVLFVIVFDVILRFLMLERSCDPSGPVRAERPGKIPSGRHFCHHQLTQINRQAVKLYQRKRVYNSIYVYVATVASLVVWLVISASPF